MTVVVVSYNHAAWVEECMVSIASQSRTPRQVIVIDDASSDGTAQIIRRVADQHPGVPWDLHLRDGNQGLTRNLNDALDLAREPLFAYISGDDRMLPDRLRVQAGALLGAPDNVTWSYSDALREDENRHRLPDDFSAAYRWPDPPLEGEVFLPLARRNCIPAPSIMVRTRALRDVGGYDEELFYEDADMLLRLSVQGRALLVPQALVVFRELPTSLGHTEFTAENPRFLKNMSRILRKHLGRSEAVDAALSPVLWHLALRRWRLEGTDEALRADMRRTWRSSPAPLSGFLYTAFAHLRLPIRHLHGTHPTQG